MREYVATAKTVEEAFSWAAKRSALTVTTWV